MRCSAFTCLTPFILNLIFAGLALGLVYILLHGRLPGWAVFLALLAVIFFPPLVPLVFYGDGAYRPPVFYAVDRRPGSQNTFAGCAFPGSTARIDRFESL